LDQQGNVRIKQYSSGLSIKIPTIIELEETGENNSSIDDLIRNMVQEIEKIARIKQGLMQDLLTGNVRVTALLEH
jgi:restriction endonuclease S subunit